MKRLLFWAPFVFLALPFLTLPAAAADFFPFEQVRAGMKGVGRTVFQGHQVEEFQVEILGVLKNVGPQQSLILARLSGGPLEKTGVMAGMSGSPVYLEGKLAGAIAYSFPFSTEPVAGIRPIQEMVEGFKQQPEPVQADQRAALAVATLADGSSVERLLVDRERTLAPPSPLPLGAEPRLMPVATMAGMAGFSERAFEVFAPRLRALGLQPMQGIGGQSRSVPDAEAPLEPGSMISVALIRGDMELSASGTLTHIDGRRIYAFGHRFLSSGPTAMPFMQSSVIALVPNLSNSFKIAGSGRLLGAITQDRNAGVAGLLGDGPRMLPLAVNVSPQRRDDRQQERQYQLEIVDDRYLAPFLLQMAVFSALDATERQLGASTFRMRGAVHFAGSTPSLDLNNMFAGSGNVSLEVATAAAIPLAYLMQSGFDNLTVSDVQLNIESIDEDHIFQIDRAWSNKSKVRPGEEIELAAALKGPEGHEVIKKTTYRIPLGVRPGDLHISVSDADSVNALEWQAFANPRRARDGSQLVRAINRLRRNNHLYMRVWRPTRGFVLETERLPAPPASVISVLSSPAAPGSGISEDWQSTLAEMELGDLAGVVRGNVAMKVSVIE